MTSTTLNGLVEALALLPDDAQLTVTVAVGDLRRAMAEHRVGAAPASLDTRQASERLGYNPERWRRWAEAGVIADAWQDVDGGSWHLPLSACEAHIRERQRRGKTAAVRVGQHEPASRSVPRGPRNRTRRPACRAPLVIAIEEAKRAESA